MKRILETIAERLELGSGRTVLTVEFRDGYAARYDALGLPHLPPRGPDGSELLGAHEVAEFLGISKPALADRRRHPSSPEPIAELKCGPIWELTTISAYKEAYARAGLDGLTRTTRTSSAAASVVSSDNERRFDAVEVSRAWLARAAERVRDLAGHPPSNLPNPARDRLTIKLPREERRHVQPPAATHVQAVVQMLPEALPATGAGSRCYGHACRRARGAHLG